jgi:drug/metabolite transporter (DMT)-like permease
MVATTSTVAELRARHRRGQAYVALGALAWSSAGILQRELTLDTTTQIGGRAVFALIALAAYVWVVERGRFGRAFRSIGMPGIAVAGCMAVASGGFILALNHTTVAHVLFIQALAPVFAAILGRVFLAEPTPMRTWAAVTIALAGVAIMIGGPSPGDIIGDVASIVMALAFSCAIVITRARRHVSMAPATCLAQLFLLLAMAPFARPGDIDGRDLVLLVLLGFGQMGLGLAFFAAGARLIPATEVALITLLEVVVAPLWVWIAVSEEPGTATLVGGAVVLAAVVLHAGSDGSRRPDPPPP